MFKRYALFLIILIFSGCTEEEYVQNGIIYNSKSLYNSIVSNINENNILYIKNQICESKLSVIPLQAWQKREINLLITEMHIKIHQINPNFNSKYLDMNYSSLGDDVLNNSLASGMSMKSSAILAIAAEIYDKNINEKILAAPEVKELMVPYEEKIDNLWKSFQQSNIGKCKFRIDDFQLGNWDEHWKLSKMTGAYDGRYRDTYFQMIINDIYSFNVIYTDYDNHTFSFNVGNVNIK